ncbi:MAG: protein-L-isoaspartate(D-aspartate) O-methyltransferase [Spirochaetia bacterium]
MKRGITCFLLILIIPFSVFCGGSDETEDAPAGDLYQKKREKMVETQLKSRGITDPGVLNAMRSVPRHKFVEPDLKDRAYADTPLPIEHGQTISQPYIVAYMTEMLELREGQSVLEIGTGSGYQAAVLAEITDHVYTVEIIKPLAQKAAGLLENLGYEETAVKSGDGYYGWPEYAPYDRIIVTAASGHIPPPLIEQLAPGGRMMIPVGGVYDMQTLILVRKLPDGSIETEQTIPVRFVPMTGEALE